MKTSANLQQSEYFTTASFSANAGPTQILTNAVYELMKEVDRPRLLDLGCGSGDQVFSLSREFKQVEIVGVDISASNIEQANEKTKTSKSSSKELRFVQVDYFQYSDQSFDLILSNTTLHLIHGETSRLFKKLYADLKPGGLLVYTMPQKCLYNTVLMGIRRAFRLFRSSWTDRLILSLAETIYKGRFSRAMLLDRVEYMYIIPERFAGPSFDTWLANEIGFELIDQKPFPHASIAQPKHTFAVWRKPLTA